MGIFRVQSFARFRSIRRLQFCSSSASGSSSSSTSTISESPKLEWPSSRVRHTFLDYYSSLGYTYVQSSSIVPYDDHSLLYVNAGMNQFKPIFLGTMNPSAKRARLRLAVNSQKCVRAGAREKDLEEVGRDGYHHTFFEMVGSWSFQGHLPKKEVCQQALRLLTDVYRLPKDRLFVTYFEGYEPLALLPDTECKELWQELGVEPDHILGRGIEDNFWEMSPSGGPCGPCTEIHYSPTYPPRAEETVELWNIVFMQYNKRSDGELSPLPFMHIDTGMGLERLCCVLQRVATTYDTDLFRPLLKEIESLSGAPPYGGQFGESDKQGIDTAYRIIADHARMFTVSIADGLLPTDTDKAGNILRLVVRRAAYQAALLAPATDQKQTGRPKLALNDLCTTVASILGGAYPELYDNVKYVREVVAQEEARFYAAMTRAKVRLGLLVKDSGGNLSMADLVSFYRTYDLPYAVFVAIAQKRGLKVNEKEFESEIERQAMKPPTGSLVKSSTSDSMGAGAEVEIARIVNDLQGHRIAMTDDSFKYQVNRDSLGHYTIPTCESKVVAIVHNNNLSATAPPNEECDVVLDRTPLFAQSGGQAGDRGTLRWGSAVFNVKTTFGRGGYVFHRGYLSMGGLARSDAIQAFVDGKWRMGCTQHHTATQLIKAILERVLGPIRQRSLAIDSESAKLGFWCATVPTPELILRVEREANEVIRQNPVVYIEELPLERAKQCPYIRWLIGVYYPDFVRVVSIGLPPRRLLDMRPEINNNNNAAGGGGGGGGAAAAGNARGPPSSRILTTNALREREASGGGGGGGVSGGGGGGNDAIPPTFISAELSSGTHVLQLSDIQQVRIVSLEGSGSSVKTVTFVAGQSASAAEERGKALRDEIKAAWEKVQNGEAKADSLLALRAKVVDAVIPFETRTHLLHDILDFRKTHLKNLIGTQNQS